MKMSLKERDRRYKLIRQGMEEQGIRGQQTNPWRTATW
jgi:hypothetical protein